CDENGDRADQRESRNGVQDVRRDHKLFQLARRRRNIKRIVLTLHPSKGPSARFIACFVSTRAVLPRTRYENRLRASNSGKDPPAKRRHTKFCRGLESILYFAVRRTGVKSCSPVRKYRYFRSSYPRSVTLDACRGPKVTQVLTVNLP